MEKAPMRRKAFAARVWAKLLRHESERLRLRPDDRVLAAVSGGPDSVCLAHFLSELRRRRGFWLGMVYVDHGLRRAAAAEAKSVRALGERLEVPVYVRRVDAAAVQRRRGQ